MEFGEGRGGLLGEDDPLYIVGEKIQPLSPHSARAARYYCTQSRYYRKGLRYYRCRVRYYRLHNSDRTRACCTGQHAVEPPERYYRAPLRYYRHIFNNISPEHGTYSRCEARRTNDQSNSMQHNDQSDDVTTGPSAIFILLNFWHYSHGSRLSLHPIGVGQVSSGLYPCFQLSEGDCRGGGWKRRNIVELFCWIYARKWPAYAQGPQLSTLCSFLTLFAWLVVISPIAVLLVWGSILIALMERNITGLAVIMVGVALLLSFYSIMLWWRTQWQSSKAVAYLLLLAVGLLCAYEFCAVYVTAGASATEINSPSGFFFGLSAISLAINMLFICKILFNGSGFDVDEYVRRSYKFAYSDCVEVAPVSCSPDPPDPTAAVSGWLSISNPSVARIDALRSTVIKLREGFRRKGQNSSSNSSEGCGSSVKRSSGSVEACQHGNTTDSIYRSNSQSDGVHWNSVPFDRSNSCQEGRSSDKNIDSGRASLAHRSNSCLSAVQDSETAIISADRHGDTTASLVVCSSSGLESQGCGSSGSATASGNQQLLDSNLAAIFQDRLNDPKITSMLKRNGGLGDVELANLLHDKGLDPNFSYMLKDKVMDPRILALLQRSSLDADREHQDDADATATEELDTTIANQISLSEELRRNGLENWLNISRLIFHQVAGTPIRSFVVFTLIFIVETVTVAVHRPEPIKVINAIHEQFEFGFSILLLSPVVCSIMAFTWSLHAEEMMMTSKPQKDVREIQIRIFALQLSSELRYNAIKHDSSNKSSVILGLSLTVPLMVACLSFAIPIWMRNGYRFWIPGGELDNRENIRQSPGKKEGTLFAISIVVFIASVIGLGAIVSAKPLDALGYRGWDADKKSFYSPYATSMYLGWALSSTIAVLVTGVIPIVAWFATYRFSPSSAICVGLFATVLVSFCGASYWGVVNSREDGIPLKADFLAALLPLLCIPAMFALFTGLYKWKDDDWKISRGVYLFVGMGMLLLLGAIAAIIVTIRPWTVGVACLLVILFLVFAIGVIHYWKSNNFYLTRTQMLLVCSLAFLLVLAAFLMGLFQGKPFLGASIGYFSFLFLLTGRALTVLLSPPIVVYSPRVLPVYVYDAHADSAKNVSYAFLILYGIALATEVWGVIASQIMNPPFVGAAICASTLVIAFSFAVSRPCLTLKMMEDAIHFLSKDTVIQAMSRSANKTRNAISGTYSAPQRSASSAALLVGDPAVTLDRAGNFVLPRADVMKLRDRLRNEEVTTGSFFCGVKNCFMVCPGSPADVDYRRNMCAHARILALEEAIDTEWVYMWDKFGGYLLLLLGLTAKAEQIQDEVRLRLFLDSIGLSDLSAKEIKKWMPEDRRQFELIQESYIREKEMEEEVLMQRREEEGKGRERRKALLEKEERKWKELEISLLSSIPNAGSRDAAAMAAAVRAVGVCLFGTEFEKKVCWEILVAGSEQGMEAGQVGLRLVTKGERMTTVAKEWNIGASSIADGRWHIVTVTIDADLGEATSFIDGVYDGYQNGLPLPRNNGVWEPGADIWVGARPPTDLDAFGRSDSEGTDSKMQIMDAFLWGRCLTEDEIAALYTTMSPAEYGFFDLAAEDAWHGSYSARVDDWESEEANYELYDQEDVEWDGQYSSGRKRPVRDAVAIDIDSFARRPRKPRFETREEVNQRMLSVERAVREALSAKGERAFTDQEFPPDDRSLYVDPGNPPLKLQVVSEWTRPSDIAKEISISSQPCLFSGSVNSSDVCQGRLGDCWFLSAVAVLTEMSRISEVIITPAYNEEGIYTIRFCIQGEWVAVVVDDWIPCESPGKPAFATSRKQNELWVSILEKAYAKLHGSYEALEGGLVQDALVDLTGGAGEEIDMRSPQAQIDLASGRLWSQLLHFNQEGFLLGAGSPSGSDAHISSSGIVQGHAYSILQIREVDGHKLVQIRNPWANEVEWNGPWSDSSQEWTERIKHKLKHVPQSKNGVFWMSWQDFQIHFRSIYVCRVYPPEMRYSVHGQWRGYSAGGCQDYDSWHQNPQYRLRVTGRDALYPVHVFITLTQGVGFSRKTNGFRNYQSSHDSSMFYIGMRILKTRGCRAAYNIYMHESVGGTDYVNSREISCELVLEPYPKGYTIVPTTIHPGEEAPFVLSVFTKAPIKLEAV
uniref:Protein DEFECTIVE KERNEL 1 n=1 Tax=Aegilops tauschii TaxID=37682 RepID=M8C6S9_AEGTA